MIIRILHNKQTFTCFCNFFFLYFTKKKNCWCLLRTKQMASLAEGQRPVLTKDELVLLCLQFGIKFDENDPKSYSMLASYDDANYRIKSNDGSGRRFVLKISNSSEKIELLQMQQTILVFLEQNKDKFSSKSSLFPIVIPLSKSIVIRKKKKKFSIHYFFLFAFILAGIPKRNECKTFG